MQTLNKEQIETIKNIHVKEAFNIMEKKEYQSDIQNWYVNIYKNENGTWNVSGILLSDPNGLQMEIDEVSNEPKAFFNKVWETLTYCYDNYLLDCAEYNDDMQVIANENYHLRNLMVFLLVMKEKFRTNNYTLKQMYDYWEWER